jgi:hypothetical protein
MNAAEIIAEIEQADGKIWTEGDRLKFRDTPARLVPLIREHKSELLALLKDQAGQRSAPPASVAPEPTMAPQSAPASVFCGQCVRFHPGEPWPWESLGRCTVTPTGLPPKGGNGYRACLPMAPRRCPKFLGPAS